MEKFPRRLKAIRVENGKKQHEIAVHLGLSDGGYQCYEQGRGYPDVPRLYELAEYFNTPRVSPASFARAAGSCPVSAIEVR